MPEQVGQNPTTQDDEQHHDDAENDPRPRCEPDIHQHGQLCEEHQRKRDREATAYQGRRDGEQDRGTGPKEVLTTPGCKALAVTRVPRSLLASS